MEKCEAIWTTGKLTKSGSPNLKEEQVGEPCTRSAIMQRFEGKRVCWLHFQAATNPNRIRPVQFIRD